MDTVASGGGGSNLDPEYVLKFNPDYIILSGTNDGWLDSIKETPKCEFNIVNRTGWRDLMAIKNCNLYELAHATSRSIYTFYPCLKMAKISIKKTLKTLPDAALYEVFNRFMLLYSDISTWFMSFDDCVLPNK